jgi:hypothetical protein
MGVEEQFVLLSLGLVIIIVRIGVRWHQVGPGNWQLDDYLMPLTGVRDRSNQSYRILSYIL